MKLISHFNESLARLAASAMLAAGLFTATALAAPGDSNWDAGYSNACNSTVYAITMNGTNAYLGGLFGNVFGVWAGKMAQWNGSNWLAMGLPFNKAVYALAIGSNQNVWAGGAFNFIGSTYYKNVARWNGSSWFSPGLPVINNQIVYAVAMGSNGTVYAGGAFSFTNGTASCLAQYTNSTWSGLGSGVNGNVLALSVSTNGDLYVGGAFVTAGGSNANGVAKWNGSSWSALGSGVNGTVMAVLAQGTNLYVGGSFTNAGGIAAKNIARWNGSSWSALGSGVNGEVYSIAANSAGDLYVGGAFTTVGTITANYIAKWNGSQWSALGSGVNIGSLTGVYAIAINSNNDVWAGGSFTQAGGKPASNLCVWHELAITNSSPLPPAPTGVNYSNQLYVVNAATTCSWSIVSNGLPAGLGLTSNGIITGMPAVVTSTNFTIKAAYADGFSTTKSFDLTTICGYQLAPVTATNVAAGYGSGGFTVLTCSGCFWSALASTNWIQTSSIGWGTNSVSFTADANPTTNARSATIQVRDQNFTVTQAKATPYQAWRFGYFTSNELADVTISGDGAAPAGDGVPNLMKYAFALNPKVAASANSLPILGVADGCLSLTYRLNSQAPDLTNIVQVCTDLVSGVWTTTNFPVLSTVTNGSFWLITVRDLVPMSNAASRFLRLKITGP